jgi:RNA polymerase sigma-70 factor (ECF subfamily)
MTISEMRGGVAHASTPDTHRLFAETVLPYLGDVLTLAKWLTGNASDAEDVTQEVCVRALKALERGPAQNARAFMLTVTRNTAFTWLKRNRPRAMVLTDDPEAAAGEAEWVPGPDAALIAAADASVVEAALAALPLPFREVLVMREINELSYRDIAEAVGVPIGTVMSRLARARKLMLVALKEERP